jgi:Transposase IS116/IS110/IS902 family
MYRSFPAAYRRVGAPTWEVNSEGFFEHGLFVDEVARLAAYRGMASEVCDWRRFPAPAKFMGFVGLVPSEYSTGASTHRSAINMEPKYTESDTFATDYWASSATLASFFGATRM